MSVAASKIKLFVIKPGVGSVENITIWPFSSMSAEVPSHFLFLQARSHFHATYYFAHNCCTVSLSLSMIHPYWQAMVTTAWIYSIQFKFWPPQLHQHLHLHSRCHLKNKTYPPTPHLHWHQYLHFKQPLQINDYHFGHASVYTTTFLLYSCLVFCVNVYLYFNLL